MIPARDRRLRLSSGVAVVALLLLAACQPGAGTASPSSQSSSEPSNPAVSASVAPSATASENLGPFTCSLPLHADATIDRSQITDVRVDGHEGYDRIVFEFASGLPEYTIDTATPPFTKDPSGLPINVAGSAFLSLVMQGGTRVTPDGMPTYTGRTEFSPGLTSVVGLVEAGDFEAVSSWYVGLTGASCVRVLTLADPSRLVIDIKH